MFLIKVLLTVLLWSSLFMVGILPFHALEQHLVTLEKEQQRRGPVVVEERIRRRLLRRGDDSSSSSFSSSLEGQRRTMKEQYSAPLDDHVDHHVRGRLEGETTTSIPTTAGRIWTQITFSVEYDEALMSHTIQHYLNLGLLSEYFLIGLHYPYQNNHNEQKSEAPPTAMSPIAERLRDEFGIRHVHEWHGNFTSQENWNQKLQQRQNVHVQDCDWIVKVDADELVRNIPYGNFPRFLETLQAKHHDVVYGTMVDRVSSTGDLLEISNTSLIQDQFPLECHITQAAHANTTKVVAFRGYLTEYRAGHGLVYGQESCPYPRRLVLDHYKWHSSVVTKLEERITHYQWLEGQGQGHHWWRESETLLKHLTSTSTTSDHDHNRDGSAMQYRINIHGPEFQCQEATSEEDDSGLSVATNLLTDGNSPPSCSRRSAYPSCTSSTTSTFPIR